MSDEMNGNSTGENNLILLLDNGTRLGTAVERILLELQVDYISLNVEMKHELETFMRSEIVAKNRIRIACLNIGGVQAKNHNSARTRYCTSQVMSLIGGLLERSEVDCIVYVSSILAHCMRGSSQEYWVDKVSAERLIRGTIGSSRMTVLYPGRLVDNMLERIMTGNLFATTRNKMAKIIVHRLMDVDRVRSKEVIGIDARLLTYLDRVVNLRKRY